MFDIASRKKFRFQTTKGEASVEDLWDLPLTSTTGSPNLDDIALVLHKKLSTNDSTSFVNAAKTTDATLQLKFDIVKHVIDVKVAERDAANLRRENKEKKDKILALIEQKKTEMLVGSSLEDLMKMANEIEA